MADILDDPKASGLCKSVALELAGKYEGLDKERTANVLARTMSDIHGRPLTKWPKVKRSADSKLKLLPPVWFFPTISEALQCKIPPEQALALFEKADLKKLGERQLYTDLLGRGAVPLYGIKQCADEIDKLVRHQRKNREDLVETGYPRTVFKNSALLTTQTVELYPVKWPSEVLEEADEYLYAWAASWKEGGPQCDYEDVPLAPGLSIKDAARLESLREKFFDIRIDVLKILALSLRENDSKDLWQKVETVLTRLPVDDAHFLLKIDRGKTGFEIKNSNSPLSTNGAFSTLLSLAGYCEKELTIGTMAKVSGALSDYISYDDGYPRLSFRSYYKVVGKQEQEKIDKTYDMLEELEEHEKAFWGEFEQRVNKTLDMGPGHRVEVVVSRFVPQEGVVAFKTNMEYFADKLVGLTRDIEQLAPSVAGKKGRPAKPKHKAKQEKQEDYESYKYKTRVKLHIPGTTHGQSYHIFVDGHETTLGRSAIPVLLRYVLELKNNPEGWVHVDKLREQGLVDSYDSTDYYDKCSLINRSFQQSQLPEDIAKNLLEKSKTKGGPKGKERRLSTRPDFVTYDKQELQTGDCSKLKGHSKVSEVAEQLPD